MVEHFADGDVFDCAMDPGWAPMSASGLPVGTTGDPRLPSTTVAFILILSVCLRW